MRFEDLKIWSIESLEMEIGKSVNLGTLKNMFEIWKDGKSINPNTFFDDFNLKSDKLPK